MVEPFDAFDVVVELVKFLGDTTKFLGGFIGGGNTLGGAGAGGATVVLFNDAVVVVVVVVLLIVWNLIIYSASGYGLSSSS